MAPRSHRSERDARYEATQKARDRKARYDRSDKGRARRARYHISTAGILAALRNEANRRGNR